MEYKITSDESNPGHYTVSAKGFRAVSDVNGDGSELFRTILSLQRAYTQEKGLPAGAIEISGDLEEETMSYLINRKRAQDLLSRSL